MILNVTDDNTSTSVTLAINGGTALPIKTAAGNDPAVGGLKSGMLLAGLIDGTNFRLLSDQASAAIQAAAEAAQAAAETARDLAIQAADSAATIGGGDIPVYPSRTLAAAISMQPARSYLTLAGRDAPGDAPLHIYTKMGSTPSPVEAWQFATADGAYWELAAGGGVTNVAYFPGVAGDGTTDCADGFTAVSDFLTASGATETLVPPGSYKISSNVTLKGKWTFAPGAVLVPDANVTVILEEEPGAGLNQIFDLSASGSTVQFPGSIREVWAEWWGAKGNNTKTDNEKPFQQAVNALQNDTGTGGVDGGVVRYGRGIFLFSGVVTIKNRVVLRGLNGRYSRLRANAATWSGTDTFWLFQNITTISVTGNLTSGSAVVTGLSSTTGLTASNTFVAGTGVAAGASIASIDSSTQITLSANATSSGTTVALTCSRHDPQFNCRIEESEIDAGDIDAITYVIYSDCWNEQCGLENVLIERFNHNGVNFEHGYGGSATLEMSKVEIFPGAGASTTANGIRLRNDLTGNYTNAILRHCVIGMDSSATISQQSGVNASGNIDILVEGQHCEDIKYGFTLDKNASVFGHGVTGGPSMYAIFSIASTWTGRIDVSGVRKGSATKIIDDGTRGYSLYNNDSPTTRVAWPPDPTIAIGACRVTSNAQVYTYGKLSLSSHAATGTYNFLISSALANSTDYEVIVQTRITSSLIPTVTSQANNGFTVTWRDSTDGSAADCSDFYIELKHRP
ncbi:MAG: hypothetical protein J0H40_17675 [Rhizobiales bacterium]|nr:hypothetical protein [Hyphomicrobiales bacterium]